MNFTLHVLTDIVVPPIADGRVLKVAINGLYFMLRAANCSCHSHVTSVVRTKLELELKLKYVLSVYLIVTEKQLAEPFNRIKPEPT